MEYQVKDIRLANKFIKDRQPYGPINVMVNLVHRFLRLSKEGEVYSYGETTFLPSPNLALTILIKNPGNLFTVMEDLQANDGALNLSVTIKGTYLKQEVEVLLDRLYITDFNKKEQTLGILAGGIDDEINERAAITLNELKDPSISRFRKILED